MASIVFLQQSAFDLHGLMYISGLLKHHGHRVHLFIVPEEPRLLSLIEEIAPDFVGFSIVSAERLWALDTAKRVKAAIKTRAVFGGIDATLCPEIIEHDPVDVVCRGEGEYPLLELLDAYERTGALDTSIDNLWVKSDGQIARNPLRPLIADLDQLPAVDRGLYYDRYRFLATYPNKRFMIGRGCPFNCSYCCNNALRQLYNGKGGYVRRHSVARVIDELDRARRAYTLRTVDFIDDDFISNKAWLRAFLQEYARVIRLPYSCLVRIDLLDEEIAEMLQATGCLTVCFGIESGDEDLRSRVLHKRLTDAAIIRGAALLKKHRLKFNSYNMLNIPGETLASGLKTVDLNVKIGTDYPWCSIFQPFPGTEFWDRLKQERGLSNEEILSGLDFYSSSLISQPDSAQLVNLEKLFYYAVKLPSLQPLITRLIRLPANRLFKYLFLASFAYRHSRANRMSLREECVYNLRHLSSYFRRG